MDKEEIIALIEERRDAYRRYRQESDVCLVKFEKTLAILRFNSMCKSVEGELSVILERISDAEK